MPRAAKSPARAASPARSPSPSAAKRRRATTPKKAATPAASEPKSAAKSAASVLDQPLSPAEKEIVNRIVKEMNQKEFGGVAGAIGIMIGLPLVVLFLFTACGENGCLFTRDEREGFSDPREIVALMREQLSTMWSWQALQVVCAWTALQAAFYLFLPAAIVPGVELRDKTRLRYPMNGHLAFWISLVACYVLQFHVPGYSLAWLYDNYLQLAVASFALSTAISAYCYWLSFANTTELLADGGNSGNHVYDFFIGRALNPRVGFLDLKVCYAMLCYAIATHLRTHDARVAVHRMSAPSSSASASASCAPASSAGRCSTSGWCVARAEPTPAVPRIHVRACLLGLLRVAAAPSFAQAAKQMEVHGLGQPSWPMIAVNVFQAVYVWDALYMEQAILTTMDITTDGFGFMLAFGDLCWVPFTYSLQARLLVHYDPHLATPHLIAICALCVLGYRVFRGANSEKARRHGLAVTTRATRQS